MPADLFQFATKHPNSGCFHSSPDPIAHTAMPPPTQHMLYLLTLGSGFFV
jgi:hypothetical protein